jgi:uncharacterized iron-regulated membrane protein
VVAAAFLFVQGLTGALLVFENEISWSMNREVMRVDVGGPLASLTTVQSEAEARHPGYRVTAFQLPPREDIAGTVTLAGSSGDAISVTYNQYTGHPLGVLDDSRFPLAKVRRFHKRLWGGAIAEGIVGWGSVILLVLSISGLVLWWPRRILTMKWSSRARRTFDLHNVIGFYSAAFLFLFALTGVVIHWENGSQKLLASVAHVAALPPMGKPSAPAAAAIPLNAQQLLTIAEKAAPGARGTMIQFSPKPGAAVRVAMKYPEDNTPAGRTNVFIDEYTGKVLSLRSSRTAPLDFKIVKLWNRQIHTGDIYGWPTRILACVFSMALPLMAITGPMLWWGKRRRNRAPAKKTEKELAIA